MIISYYTLSRYFADVRNKDILELGRFIGGKVQTNIDSGVFKNGCAIRMSYVFNYAGVTISPVDGAVSSGKDGKWYLYRVSDIIGLVKKTIRSTPISGRCIADFKGKKGIIIFSGCGWIDASGHVDLFDGSKVEGSDYFNTCSKVELYVIN